jgi:DHA2 family multidrug resistance protein
MSAFDAPRAVAQEPTGRAGDPVEHDIPTYRDTLQQITNYFTTHGSSLAQAQDQAIQWIGSFLGYVDAFWVLMLISLSAVPLALALSRFKLGGAFKWRPLR